MSERQPAFSQPAERRSALDRAHIGDIEGALGTVRSVDTGPRRSLRRKLATLLAVAGPGIVVMVADNDAGTFSVFAKAGQEHGTRLLWMLLLLVPALCVIQEMAARLGAVTGAGHARLTLERFGKLWCAFSLGDLLVLNLATLITEFIGVALALSYFGASRYLTVPIAASVLIAVTVTGSFRLWERAMYLMIAADLALIPLALIHHPPAQRVAEGLLPTFGSGPASSTVLLLVALVGTTLVPWQLFFQQSTVVDKRITPRWLAYERAETAIGAILFAASAAAVLILTATTHAGSPFTNVGAVAHAIGLRLGRQAGAVFAIALLNGSLLCAAAVSLSGSYAIAEVFGLKHSLHRKFSDAKSFHATSAAIIASAAAIVLIPGLPLGALTTLVQALGGILLPSTLVLLLLLCNDTELLGPLRNPRWLNAVAGTTITLILGLSTMLTITTVFPRLDVTLALLLTAGLLLAAALALVPGPPGPRRSWSSNRQLTPWQRRTWSAPTLELVPAPSATPRRVRTLGLLRIYTSVITGLLLLKLIGALPG